MSAAADVLLEIFSEMLAQGANFALLGGEEPVPLDASSDIDLVLACDPRPIVDPILKQMQDRGKVLVIQRLHYEVPYGFYYVIKCANGPGELLLLDCLFDPWGLGHYHVCSTYLLQGRKPEPWGYRASDERNAIYLLVKCAVKGAMTLDKRRILERAISINPSEVWSEVDRWFGAGGRGLVERLLAARDGAACAVELAGLRPALESRFRYRHPLRYLSGRVLSLLRQLRRAGQPTGLFVVVLGPDGSGKSTASDIVLRDLERAFRRSWRFHWRPGLLPKLSRAQDGAATETPPVRSKYTGIVSLARFVYYWLDFTLGYWLVVTPKIARTTLVVGERYFPDVLVQPERYGFAVPRGLMRLAARLVPKPDLIVLLKDDPDAVHGRKPELSPARIGALLDAYEAELKHWGNARILTTEGGAAAVAERLAALILEARAARTARRIGWTG